MVRFLTIRAVPLGPLFYFALDMEPALGERLAGGECTGARAQLILPVRGFPDVESCRFLALAIAAVHFYLLARTGHIDPRDAAFARLEYENIGYFKSKSRELVVDEEQQQLFDEINRRNIVQCYRIALF